MMFAAIFTTLTVVFLVEEDGNWWWKRPALVKHRSIGQTARDRCSSHCFCSPETEEVRLAPKQQLHHKREEENATERR